MTTAMPCEHIEIIIVIVIMITLSLYLAPFPFSLSSPSSPLGVHDDLLFDLPCVPDQKTITMMAIEIMINIMMRIFLPPFAPFSLSFSWAVDLQAEVDDVTFFPC